MRRSTGCRAVLLLLAAVILLSLTACGKKGYTIDTAYTFAADLDGLGSDAEKREACQLPRSALKGMTTEALCETVFCHPMVSLMLAFDEPQQWYETWMVPFNGLKELQTRKDASAVLDAVDARFRAGKHYDNAPGSAAMQDKLMTLIRTNLGI